MPHYYPVWGSGWFDRTTQGGAPWYLTYLAFWSASLAPPTASVSKRPPGYLLALTPSARDVKYQRRFPSILIGLKASLSVDIVAI